MTKKHCQGSRRSEAGFTLIEILIVLGVIGVIAVSILPNIFERLDRANFEKTRLAMSQIVENITVFQQDCGKVPSDLKYLKEPDPECKRWGPNPYTKTIPNDGWGRPFLYESDGVNYTLRSLGKDGREGGKNKIDQDISSEDL